MVKGRGWDYMLAVNLRFAEEGEKIDEVFATCNFIFAHQTLITIFSHVDEFH